VDASGHSAPNYHYEDLIHAAEWYLERGLDNPTIIVDTNHANSNRQYAEQPRIGLEVAQSRRNARLLGEVVQGLMVESYLLDGSQREDGDVYGQSITDPCLGWEETEPFVKQLADWV
jgi:3-deoxy-7-phosphoheptulonate synthase